MPKVATEARRLCPELIEAVKLIDALAWQRSYGQVFDDLVSWMVWQHHFPPHDDNPLKGYSAEEQKQFGEAFKVIQEATKTRTSLHSDRATGKSGWYDPLGRLYECITSKNKSQILGQYFTPRSVVNAMTEIIIGKGEGEMGFKSVLDPCSGSGRMGLAAAMQLMAQGNPCWITMNDIDPICAKMTAANMCLNGVVGEALCSNGLDITGESYRFGYRVEPMLAQIPPERRGLYQMAMLAQTGQNIAKQYVIKPISYEQSYLKQANDRLLKEAEQRQQITEAKEREKAVQELETRIKERMQGTLFEEQTGEFIQAANENQKQKQEKAPKLPPASVSHQDKLKEQRQVKPPSTGTQGKLF